MDTVELNGKLEIPEDDKASPIKENEAQYIYELVKEHDFKKTLEVGFAYARSASHIIHATQRKHITIDPFQENYKYLGSKNLESLGYKEFLDYRNDYSHNVLPQFVKDGEKFDFIFIDGDHKFDGIFVDFYYADLLLEKNGYVLFHDTWMRSTKLVTAFIKSNREDYKEIKTPLRNLQLFQKVGSDSRNGMFFREFYTFKSILTHNLIMWMTSGKQNFLKKIMFQLKEAIK